MQDGPLGFLWRILVAGLREPLSIRSKTPDKLPFIQRFTDCLGATVAFPSGSSHLPISRRTYIQPQSCLVWRKKKNTFGVLDVFFLEPGTYCSDARRRFNLWFNVVVQESYGGRGGDEETANKGEEKRCGRKNKAKAECVLSFSVGWDDVRLSPSGVLTSHEHASS